MLASNYTNEKKIRSTERKNTSQWSLIGRNDGLTIEQAATPIDN